MQIVKRLIVIFFFFFSYLSGAFTVVLNGIDVVVIKKDKKQVISKIHFNSSYAIKFKKMSYRSANIYIKHLLIKAFRDAKLNASELGKFHIFISKKQLKLFKVTGVLLVRLNYKARAYTQILLKVQLNRKSLNIMLKYKEKR